MGLQQNSVPQRKAERNAAFILAGPDPQLDFTADSRQENAQPENFLKPRFSFQSL